MNPVGYNRPQKRRMLRWIIVSSLIIIGLIMILADRQQKSMLKSGRIIADDVNSRILGFLAKPVRAVESFFSDIEIRQNAIEENKKLKAELARLKNIENRLLDAEMRLAELAKIHGSSFSKDVPKSKILARIINETKGPFVRSGLINAGIDKNIKKGSAVMSVDGLYGYIIRVGTKSSRVLLLGDLNSRIAVMSQRSGARAIMAGKNSPNPELEYIAINADWKDGDRVVTSGDGGVLPRGLYVGTASLSKNGNFYVKPASMKNPVDWVFVYNFTGIEKPEKNGEEKQDGLVLVKKATNEKAAEDEEEKLDE